MYLEYNNLIEVIRELVINHIMYFIKDDIKLVQLFFNYIDSVSNLFEMKDGTLQVKLKTLLELNYNRKI